MPSPLTIIFTIFGGLILAGVLGWIRKPRLIVLVPRLFSYSRLTDRGQIADITVFNRGFKTEEVIELSLNPNLRYEVLGSNSQDVDLSKSKLAIARIGPGDEVATLLLVEGGVFTSADITNCLSKGSKGRIVAKLDDVEPTGPQRIRSVVEFGIIGTAIWALVGGIWYLLQGPEELKTEQKVEAEVSQTAVAEPIPKVLDINGWQVPVSLYENSDLLKELSEGRISVEIGEVRGISGGTSVPVHISNRTEAPIKVSVSIEREGTDYAERLSFDSSLDAVIVAKNSSVERGLTIGKSNTSSGDTIYVEVLVKPLVTGHSIRMVRAVTGVKNVKQTTGHRPPGCSTCTPPVVARIEEITKENFELPRHQGLALVRLLLDLDQPGTSSDIDSAWGEEIRARFKAA